jgi:hypothetical protein
MQSKLKTVMFAEKKVKEKMTNLYTLAAPGPDSIGPMY